MLPGVARGYALSDIRSVERYGCLDERRHTRHSHARTGPPERDGRGM